MTAQSALFAKANLYEHLMERASELTILLMVMRNMLIELAKDTDNMSLERSLKQIATVEDILLPTELVECLHRYGGPGRGDLNGHSMQ